MKFSNHKLNNGGYRIVGKRVPLIAVAFFSVLALVPMPAFALGEIAEFFSNFIFSVVTVVFGKLLNFLLSILMDVASYNSFSSAKIVEIGWITVRDVSNMFFILILLIIAIGTIVKWETINYRKNLRRLVLMALLINFSKTIVIFFTDFSQVITLTFISAVKDIAQAGTLKAFGLDVMVNPVANGIVGDTIDIFTFVVGAIAVVIACLVVAVILIIFVVRIIALWLLIIFSPLAFIASTLPQTKRWYDKWWETFGQNLTVAPALAFMLWLFFAFVSSDEWADAVPVTNVQVSSILSSTVVSYIISIAILMYSIKLAVQMGAAGGKIASNFASGVQGRAISLGKRFAYGRSGQGGALGLARGGLATAVTRPGDAARAAGGTAVRLADTALTVGTLGISKTLGLTGKEGLIRERAGRLGARYDRMTTAGREKFEKQEGFAARQIRRLQRPVEVGEKERQRVRATDAGKAMNIDQMTHRQLKNELQTGSPLYDARKAAASRELLKRGEVDTLKHGKWGKELSQEEVAKLPDADKRELEQGQQLAQRAIRYVTEDSGLTPEEKESIKQRNIRHFDVNTPEIEDTIKTMLTEGKTFSRQDLTSQNSVKEITRIASETLSGSEFKKFVDKIPRESKGSATNGLRAALEGLVTNPKLPPTHEDNATILDKRETIRNQLARFDPDKIEKYAHPIIEEDYTDAAGTPGKRVVFDESKGTTNPEYNRNLDKLVKGLKVSTIGDMKATTLESIGKRFSANTIIKADSHEDINSTQSIAMQRGLAKDINKDDTNVVANFETIVENPYIGKQFQAMIKQAFLEEKDPHFEKAYELLLKMEKKPSDKGSKKKRRAGFTSPDLGSPAGGAGADTQENSDEEEET